MLLHLRVAGIEVDPDPRSAKVLGDCFAAVKQFTLSPNVNIRERTDKQLQQPQDQQNDDDRIQYLLYPGFHGHHRVDEPQENSHDHDDDD
jgi:hypothetical protein